MLSIKVKFNRYWIAHPIKFATQKSVKSETNLKKYTKIKELTEPIITNSAITKK